MEENKKIKIIKDVPSNHYNVYCDADGWVKGFIFDVLGTISLQMAQELINKGIAVWEKQ